MEITQLKHLRTKYKLLRIWRRILAVLFPERCPYCNKVIEFEEASCEACAKGLFRDPLKKNTSGGYPCVSAVPYNEPYKNGIWGLKFSDSVQFAPQLARVMAKAIEKSYRVGEIDALTYIPLHPKRQKERGYNQSELLARELSYLLEIPLESLLVKTKNNPPQHETEAANRRENVKGVYEVKDKAYVTGKRILLIDDIITTGSTLGEAAKMLTLAGAEQVFCATFACVVPKTT